MIARQFVIALLMTTSVVGMDHFFDTARSCNPECIRAIIPPEALQEKPLEFFNIALACPNARTILEEFDKKIKENKPTWTSTFAHLVNKAHKNSSKNHFLEKLIERGKYK